MTKIAFNDGKPIMRGGKVGIGQGCCCGCHRCIRGGEWDCQYTTKEACEDCLRTYFCDEYIQNQCDGTCPDGFYSLGNDISLSFSSACGLGYGGSAYVAVGCGAILSATVGNGGSGYADIGRVPPTLSAAIEQGEGAAGAGGQLSISLEQHQDACGRDLWRIASINVVQGGAGYQGGDPVVISAAGGDYVAYNTSGAIEVDENGVVTGVSLEADWFGNVNRGEYYREDATAPAYVFTPIISVSGGGGGSGATFTAVVDDAPSSPTFGKVTSVSVTNGGSGYVSLCSRFRWGLADCSDCPPRSSPESSTCGVATETGACGDWRGGFSCDEPPLPCCDSCLVLPPPAPSSPTRTCVPTLNVEEITSDYIKTSSIHHHALPSWLDVAWNEQWLAEHSGCEFVWVQDYVSQTNATGTYCGFALQFLAADPFGPGVNPGYQPPQGCELIGIGVYCHVYNKKWWARMRLFLVDCRDRTLRDVTDEATTEPIEWGGCLVPAERFYCGFLGESYPNCIRPACQPPQSDCAGENPGFLSAEPTLECGE